MPFELFPRQELCSVGYSGLMSLGFEKRNPLMKHGHIPVPEGRATIAQRFSVGSRLYVRIVPKGRPTDRRSRSSLRDSGRFFPSNPTLKSWAIIKHPFGIRMKFVALDIPIPQPRPPPSCRTRSIGSTISPLPQMRALGFRAHFFGLTTHPRFRTIKALGSESEFL
jgi:hypothetical protein